MTSDFDVTVRKYPQSCHIEDGHNSTGQWLVMWHQRILKICSDEEVASKWLDDFLKETE